MEKINIDVDEDIKILIYNKPLGEETAKVAGEKKTVFDNLPKLKDRKMDRSGSA